MADIDVSDREEINFKYNLAVYFGFLKKYKGASLFLIFLVFLLNSLELAFIYAFKMAIDDLTRLANHQVTLADFTGSLPALFSLLLGIPAARALGRWLHLRSINVLETDLITDIKRFYFNHLLELSHGFHTSHKTGSLISRLSRASGAVETMTDVIIFQILPLFFQLILVGAAIFHFTLAVGTTVFATAFFYILFSFILNESQRRSNARFNNMSDLEKANIADVFTNIDSIKFFAKENDIKKRFNELSDKTKQLQLDFWNYFKLLESGQIAILGLGTFFLVYFSIHSVLAGAITIGTFVFIYTAFGALLSPLSSFVYGIRNLYRATADFEDLFQYGKIENEIKDRPGAEPLRVSQGGIHFKGVAFTYKKRPILSDFSLKIPPHKKVALVGPSGAGKTTLIRLLYRLYDLEAGSITIDGADITAVTQASLRDSLSMVPQECILFDDTLYNNIAFSKPGASRTEVFSAIQFAQLGKFIEGLPSKENTIVGERGVKLSGGEKQRVSIARALLADKKILVLDEATSSLDSGTEHEIQKGLQDLMKGRTSILIAHRLSTIMSADIIVVLDKGRVVQQGTHKSLIRKPGLYRKLWNLQKGGYIH
ncbi:MAG TPA: ABC transporter ATP-binding protein [bacterium]|jgi:ABC-type multidrug transport system fused ATPase/permease subunit|nr:ABC transporter ATP-binding protein [bacterium]